MVEYFATFTEVHHHLQFGAGLECLIQLDDKRVVVELHDFLF